MKPAFKQKTVWALIVGVCIPVALLIVNKAFEIGFTTAEMGIVAGSITTIISGFIGMEKIKDAKVISKKLEGDIVRKISPAIDILETIAQKDKKIEKVLSVLKEGSNTYAEIKKNIK